MLESNAVELRALHAAGNIVQSKSLTNETQLGRRPADLLSAADLPLLKTGRSRKGRTRQAFDQIRRLVIDAACLPDTELLERGPALPAAAAAERQAR